MRKKMVGARGFEPPASWSRTRRASICKDIPCNISSETQELRLPTQVWLDVFGCARLTLGSLQKSLQSIRDIVENLRGANWPPMGGAFQS
jgi:hypothetical protein